MAKSLHDVRYKRLIALLVTARNDAGITQRDLATRLKQPPSYVAKVETLQRRMDVIEVVEFLEALSIKPGPFLGAAITSLSKRGG